MRKLVNGKEVECSDLEVAQRATDEESWAAGQAQREAAVQRLQVDAEEQRTCKLDGTIMNLVNQTRAEWRTWSGANFPSLTPGERTRLGDLCWIVSIAVRRRIR